VSYAYQEYQVGYGRRHGGSCLLTNKKGAVNVEFKVPAKNGQKSASLKKLKILIRQIPCILHGKKYLNHLKKGVAGYLC
jgi:hypothetical protein